MKRFFFYIVGFFSKESTLTRKTWAKIEKTNPNLYKIKKDYDKHFREINTNNFKSALLIVSFVIGVLFLLYCIPEAFTKSYLHWLAILKFPEKTNAYSLTTETMGAASSIIGLSFVVIGFLFEIIRNKTQRTYEDLFRASRLYFVFAITVVSMILLIILNTIKYSVSFYIAVNFAILSSLLLIGITISVCYLFYKVIEFFNPEKIAALSKGSLLKSAKYFLLNENFVNESKIVFKETYNEYGFYEEQLSFFSTEPYTFLEIGNKKEMILVDVFLPLLNVCAQRIKKRSRSGSFYSLHCQQYVNINEVAFCYADGTVVTRWEKLLVSFAFKLQPFITRENEFKAEKHKMETRLKGAAESGNMDALNQTLLDMHDLYKIYYDNLNESSKL